jgi:5-carboxymethyl-2-hydroxymuconic-semialdehyde dehydrogenase/aminomuconate-semialdehyde/2-hydroxymuconate-6-semialdehyde dehydrogenase
VVEADDNALPLCQQELFGPFVTIQRVRNLDDAIARANDSAFGLAAYIWSNDLPSVMRARRELRAGTVWVNTSMAGSIELFTEEKSTLIPHEPLDLPGMGRG